MKGIYLIGIASILLFLGSWQIYTSHPEPDWLVYYNVPLATLSYVAVILTAVFIGYQARLFLKDYKNKNERAEFELSYRMANYYGTEIIVYMAPIKAFLIEINNEVLSEHKSKFFYFEKFTANEAISLFPTAPDDKSVISKFQELYNKTIPADKLIKLFAALEGKTRLEVEKEWSSLLDGKTEDEANAFYADKSFEFRKQVVILFNKIEYFSMFFCSGLAIPENVYMSLHQTFFDYIDAGYLYICYNNKHPGHEFYMHTIALFNQWKKTMIDDEKKKRKERELIEKQISHTNSLCVPKKINQA